jgi:hypothetical protein
MGLQRTFLFPILQSAIAHQAAAKMSRRVYRVERLIGEHGDAKLTNLLVTLANCPKARSISIHDCCAR